MAYGCKVAADSISPAGDRLTTLVVTAPRPALLEISKCADLFVTLLDDSQVPLVTAMQQAREDPWAPDWDALPVATGAIVEAKATWREAAKQAEHSAYVLSALGVPNQIAKRLLAPFLWSSAVVSGTEWFGLSRLARLHEDEAVRMMVEIAFEAVRRSEPKPCKNGGWHAPGYDGHFAVATDRPIVNGVFKGWA